MSLLEKVFYLQTFNPCAAKKSIGADCSIIEYCCRLISLSKPASSVVRQQNQYLLLNCSKRIYGKIFLFFFLFLEAEFYVADVVVSLDRLEDHLWFGTVSVLVAQGKPG